VGDPFLLSCQDWLSYAHLVNHAVLISVLTVLLFCMVVEATPTANRLMVPIPQWDVFPE
jgi:hypothetical protein